MTSQAIQSRFERRTTSRYRLTSQGTLAITGALRAPASDQGWCFSKAESQILTCLTERLMANRWPVCPLAAFLSAVSDSPQHPTAANTTKRESAPLQTINSSMEWRGRCTAIHGTTGGSMAQAGPDVAKIAQALRGAASSGVRNLNYRLDGNSVVITGEADTIAAKQTAMRVVTAAVGDVGVVNGITIRQAAPAGASGAAPAS